MLNGISNPFGTDMQAASAVFCTSLVLFAGRKVCLAAGCKLVGAFEGLAGMQNADAWSQTGDEYMALAKNDAFRDIAVVAAFVAAVSFARYAEESLTIKEEEAKPEEPGYFQSYGMPAIKYGATLSAGALFKPLAKMFKGAEFTQALRHTLLECSGDRGLMGKAASTALKIWVVAPDPTTRTST